MSKAALAQWLERLETLHPKAMDLGLERVSAVATELELLPPGCPVVTVAGTNGKGSTVAALEAILAADGRVTGSFTSPHLIRFNERIRIAGQEVADEEIVAAFTAIEDARGQITLTYFEFAALAALLVFKARQPDVVILEVGLGGRLDAVNIVDADVAVITGIDIDHQQWLGDSRASIAVEKAGILRAGRPAIIADPRPPAVLLDCAAASGAHPVLCLGRDFFVADETDGWRAALRGLDGAAVELPSLPWGSLLPANLCAAAQAALLLGVPADLRHWQQALAGISLAGRRERQVLAGKEYVLDVGHNPAAVDELLEFLGITPCTGRSIALFSAMADKDIHAIIQAAAGRFDAWFIADQPANARAVAAADVADLLRGQGQGMISVSKNIQQAFRRAQNVMAEGDRLVVFGSFTTVGAVMSLLEKDRRKR